MKKMRSFLKDVINILSKDFLSLLQKRSLLFSYIEIRKNRRRASRTLEHLEKVRVAGFDIYYDNFEDFYWTFREVFIEGGYFFKTTEEEPLIVDCGANIGVSLIFFKFLYPNAHVIVIEPDRKNLQYLKRTIEANNFGGSVTLVPKAVSDTIGTIDLYGVGRAVTMVKGFHEAQKATRETYTSDDKGAAETILLSSLVTRKVDCLKLDIEGAEYEVLSDLRKSGAIQQIEYMVIENHEYSNAEQKLSNILELLEENGFVYVVHGGEESRAEKGGVKINYHMITAEKKK